MPEISTDRASVAGVLWGQERGLVETTELFWGEVERRHRSKCIMCHRPQVLSSASACISFVLFSIFWCFDIWGLAKPEETVPLRTSHFLEIVKRLTWEQAFHWQTSQSRVRISITLIRLSRNSSYWTNLPDPIHSRARYQLTRSGPYR